MFITISREYGAGGSSLARMVADRLGWRVIDNQIVEEVARRAGMSPDEVAAREERGPSFIERLARAMVVATPEMLGTQSVDAPEAEEARLVRLTGQVVEEVCREGNAVLVGRGAVALIGRREGALHVRLVGSADHRAEVVAGRLGIEFDEALKKVDEVDANRERYHRQWYDREWRDPANYHLTINSDWLGLERSAELVVTAVRQT